MGLPQLETCCMVAGLKTGNLIIGSLNALLSLIQTVIFIMMAVATSLILDMAKKDPKVGPEQQATLTAIYVLTVIVASICLAKFFFDAFFIYGVAAERPGIIKAYFIVLSVFFILSVITFFMNISQYNAVTIVAIIVGNLFNVYTILLSHSYYRRLTDGSLLAHSV